MRKYLASLAFALTLPAAAPMLAATGASTDDSNASAAVAVEQVQVRVPVPAGEIEDVFLPTWMSRLAASRRTNSWCTSRRCS